MVRARRIGNYLRVDDVDDGDVLEIINPGELRNTEFRDQVLNILVKPYQPQEWRSGGKVEKTWSLNRTSEDTLLKAFGPETENWVGKLSRVSIVKQNVRGTFKEVIYSDPIPMEEQPKLQGKLNAGLINSTGKDEARSKLPGRISPEVKVWLYENQNLIGMNRPIPVDIWNETPESIRHELKQRGALSDREGYPYITETAGALIK